MAWNPSPEVAVARDAGVKLARLAGGGVAQVVILYVTDAGQLGMVSYGRTKELCADAKVLGDHAFDLAMSHFD